MVDVMKMLMDVGHSITQAVEDATRSGREIEVIDLHYVVWAGSEEEANRLNVMLEPFEEQFIQEFESKNVKAE